MIILLYIINTYFKKSQSLQVLKTDTTIQPNFQNSHNTFFTFQPLQSGTKVTYIEDNDLDIVNWRNQEKIPKGKISTFKIKQIHTKSRNVLTGIATSAISDLFQAYDHPQVIVYSSYSGYLYQNSEEFPQVGRAVNDGEVIELIVDLVKWQVSWFVGPQKLAKAQIPEDMRDKQLFVVIMMKCGHDIVQMLK